MVKGAFECQSTLEIVSMFLGQRPAKHMPIYGDSAPDLPALLAKLKGEEDASR